MLWPRICWPSWAENDLALNTVTAPAEAEPSDSVTSATAVMRRSLRMSDHRHHRARVTDLLVGHPVAVRDLEGNRAGPRGLDEQAQPLGRGHPVRAPVLPRDRDRLVAGPEAVQVDPGADPASVGLGDLDELAERAEVPLDRVVLALDDPDVRGLSDRHGQCHRLLGSSHDRRAVGRLEVLAEAEEPRLEVVEAGVLAAEAAEVVERVPLRHHGVRDPDALVLVAPAVGSVEHRLWFLRVGLAL